MRNRVKQHIVALLAICLVVSSCSTAFGSFPNTPDGVYESFWVDFKRFYAYEDAFTESSVLEGELTSSSFVTFKTRYDSKPRDSFQQVAELLRDIENDLLDPHVEILDRGGFPEGINRHDYDVYEGVSYHSFEETWNEKNILPIQNISEFKIDDFSNFVVGVVDKTSIGVSAYDDELIGYIGIKDLVLQLSGASRLGGSKDWIEKIETIIDTFNKAGVTHSILDIRSDAGGSLFNAKYIAARFATGKQHALTLEERYRDSTFHKRDLYIEPEGRARFTGPLAILINKRTCSGGEMLTLFASARDQAKIIGNNSKGCTGAIVERDLPNGWVFRLTSSRSFQADGTSYLRVGITPDLEYSQDTSGTDSVLKEAVALLVDSASAFYTNSNP